jgi:hypothetical protein
LVVKWHALVNAALFQATWFAAVLFGTGAALVAAGLLGWHAAARGTAKADLTLAAFLAVIGLGLDTAWIYLGVLDYNGAVVAPPWIVVLWGAVGLSVNHSLSFLQRSPWLAAVLVGPAGAISYLAGAEFGGVVIPQMASLLIVVVVWALLFFLLIDRVVPFFNRLCLDPYVASVEGTDHAAGNRSG